MDKAIRAMRLNTVLEIIALSIQGWTGDIVNVFATFPNSVHVEGFPQYFSTIASVGGIGPVLVWHEIEAVVIAVIAAVVVALSLKAGNKRLALFSIFGLVTIISAIAGGLMFVLSGFTDGTGSAQMGGSFIAAYAIYFLILYLSKP